MGLFHVVMWLPWFVEMPTPNLPNVKLVPPLVTKYKISIGSVIWFILAREIDHGISGGCCNGTGLYW